MMIRSSLNTSVVRQAALSVFLATSFLSNATAETTTASLHKWALDKSTAKQDDSFSLAPPDADGEPLVVRFTFLSRSSSEPPQVRSIFDTSSFAAYLPEDNVPVVMRLEIKGDIPGRHVRLRLVDVNSEVFDTGPLEVGLDYSTLEFPLDSFIEAHWGGDNNGKIDWPLRMVRVETVDWAGASPTDGETLSIQSLSADITP